MGSNVLPGTSLPMEYKLLSKVEKVPFSGCWLWTGAVDRDGYGRMSGASHGVNWFKFAHRASYEHYNGPIPEDKQVLHTCDIPCCINPYHLYLGDPARNGLDKKERGRAKGMSRPGPLNPMYGRTGQLNPFYGKKHTEETKRKISAANSKPLLSETIITDWSKK